MKNSEKQCFLMYIRNTIYFNNKFKLNYRYWTIATYADMCDCSKPMSNCDNIAEQFKDSFDIIFTINYCQLLLKLQVVNFL